MKERIQGKDKIFPLFFSLSDLLAVGYQYAHTTWIWKRQLRVHIRQLPVLLNICKDILQQALNCFIANNLSWFKINAEQSISPKMFETTPRPLLLRAKLLHNHLPTHCNLQLGGEQTSSPRDEVFIEQWPAAMVRPTPEDIKFSYFHTHFPCVEMSPNAWSWSAARETSHPFLQTPVPEAVPFLVPKTQMSKEVECCFPTLTPTQGPRWGRVSEVVQSQNARELSLAPPYTSRAASRPQSRSYQCNTSTGMCQQPRLEHRRPGHTKLYGGKRLAMVPASRMTSHYSLIVILNIYHKMPLW